MVQQTGKVDPGAHPHLERHRAVQGLRAACVLAILAFHVLNAGLIPAPRGDLAADAVWLAHGMRYGVEVFFMISGYVIVGSLRRHASIGAFLQDRALRIFPLWIPLALAMLAAGYVGALHGGHLPAALTSGATLLPSLAIMAPILPVPGIHPAQWSLNYELWFYALAALGWWLGAGSVLRIAAWVLPAALMVTLFPRGLFFVPGVIVAVTEPWLRRHARWLRFAWVGLAIAWVAWLSTNVEAAALTRTLVDLAIEGHGPAVLLAFAGATAFFAWIVIVQRDASRGLLVHPAMQWLGMVSYSFYLVHPIVLAAVKHGLLPHLPIDGWLAAAVLAGVGLPLSCLSSWATWSLLEVRLRRWLVAELPSRRARLPLGPAAPPMSRNEES
jgi:peptidoglycan/LPS O-acetylase OafA/YrhL